MRQVLVLGSAFVVLVTGCLSEKRGDKMDEELTATKMQVLELKGELERKDAIDRQVALREEQRASDEAVKFAALDGKVEQVNAELAHQQAPLVMVTTSDHHLRKAAQIRDASALRAAFNQRQYSLVVQAAPRLIKASKAGANEDQRYLYAESLFRLHRPKEAARAFRVFLERHPNSAYAEQATLRLGETQLAMAHRPPGSLAH